MARDSDLKGQIQRIATLVEQVESCGDPNSRALMKELLGAVMALHGAGLERILELARECGEAGKELIQKCGQDELASSVLLLYGLHPENLQTRVEHVLEQAKAFLDPGAAQAELVSIDATGEVHVRLHHKAKAGCGGASLRSRLEAVLVDAAPDAATIVVEEAATSSPAFIPIAQLQQSPPLAAAQSANFTRSRD